MTPKLTLADKAIPINVVIVTMDSHLASAVANAQRRLQQILPQLRLKIHAASEWSTNSQALSKCLDDIQHGNLIIVTMLFMEDHFLPVLEALQNRRVECDALICAMSAPEVTRMTKMGKFDMSAPAGGFLTLLKRMKGDKKNTVTTGAQQMNMLRKIPRILRFIPGAAQDVRAYFLTLQYWLGGSEQNIDNMVRMLIDRYAAFSRMTLKGKIAHAPPVEYPEVGLYHPHIKNRLTTVPGDILNLYAKKKNSGRVGLLLLRSYLLAGNTAHYDGVIQALEKIGLQVLPIFATGLDARPAIKQFFYKEGRCNIDLFISLTGFSLVGGPAYNDAHAAEQTLSELDVPYIAAHPVEFQMLEDWENSDRGLLPIESTIMIAIPELDGAIAPTVFGGRARDSSIARDMQVHSERANALAMRAARHIRLRQTPTAERRIAIVIFNFPPNAGNVGTAAHLSVFESLYNTLTALQRHEYSVALPASVNQLREMVLRGNAQTYGALANVMAKVKTDDHVLREKWLSEIESQWGPAPGKQLSDGASIHILGAQFGNIFVGIQPSMGYEGDPMRLLFEKGFAPTHAFSAFYRYIREDFQANAVLHFGTHGALEFMPGKQTGLSDNCWPSRLIGDLPNFYLYASNNPSEGTIAKRRSNATLISYLTPPLCEAGIYKNLFDLKNSVQYWRSNPELKVEEKKSLLLTIQSQAYQIGLTENKAAWQLQNASTQISKLLFNLIELEETLIPNGLHVVGGVLTQQSRVDMLIAIAKASYHTEISKEYLEQLLSGSNSEQTLMEKIESADPQLRHTLKQILATDQLINSNAEVSGILKALNGQFIRPAPGGDILHTPEILPTGRNLHGFDPFRIPSAHAIKEGYRQVSKLIDRHIHDGHGLPETVALVLWGTDNLKTEGTPIAQALALLGAEPRFDSYGRLAGAILIPKERLNRPRIDVVITLSGIFRDLLPLQIKLLAEAAFLAATAEENTDENYVRKHALHYQQLHNCDMETAALRVFGNAEGTYGANVNHLIESSRWDDEEELAETYSRRKGFAYGRNGRSLEHKTLLNSILSDVDIAYQNLDSVELGVTTVDTYFDTLGGISRAIRRAKKGGHPAIYINDPTQRGGVIRTLSEQVAIETHTRMLNPRWYEGMLKHGYEGVRQIETHVTNTMGGSTSS
jgi:magnesium chelatase subunit H